jgi:ubiquinone/menaquinone biosynthesis C-methylase UbiE
MLGDGEVLSPPYSECGKPVDRLQLTIDRIPRVPRSKAQCKANYTKMSSHYDLLTARSEREFTDKGLLQFDAQPAERVLEIGFGTGYALSVNAHRVGDLGKVFGLDISEGMLKVATERLQKELMYHRCDLRIGDATKLPYMTGFFDGVFLSFTLELFDNAEIPLVLKEIRRVLRTGGRLTVISLVRKIEKTAVRIYEWAHRVMPTLVDCRPIYAAETLSAVPFFELTQCTEYTMWGLPVQVVTVMKIGKDSEEPEDYDEESSPPLSPTSATLLSHSILKSPRRSNSSGDLQQQQGAVHNRRGSCFQLEVGFPVPNKPAAARQEGEGGEERRSLHPHALPATVRTSSHLTFGGPSPSASFAAGNVGVRPDILREGPRCLWEEDREAHACRNCGAKFRIYRRRHHCRACGRLVCDKCCSRKVQLVRLDGTLSNPERICVACCRALL